MNKSLQKMSKLLNVKDFMDILKQIHVCSGRPKQKVYSSINSIYSLSIKIIPWLVAVCDVYKEGVFMTLAAEDSSTEYSIQSKMEVLQMPYITFSDQVK